MGDDGQAVVPVRRGLGVVAADMDAGEVDRVLAVEIAPAAAQRPAIRRLQVRQGDVRGPGAGRGQQVAVLVVDEDRAAALRHQLFEEGADDVEQLLQRVARLQPFVELGQQQALVALGALEAPRLLGPALGPQLFGDVPADHDEVGVLAAVVEDGGDLLLHDV